MDFSALQGVCNAGISSRGLSEEDRTKEQMNAMAKANHFLNVNGEILGAEARSMTTFAAAIGCTAMGKDTTCAQIVNKKDVAVPVAELVLSTGMRRSRPCKILPRGMQSFFSCQGPVRT